MNNDLTRVEALNPVVSTSNSELATESTKAIDLEALKLIGVSSINLDINKEPVKAIDLFLFAYGSLRPDESLKEARNSVRGFLKANRTLKLEGFGVVEPSTLLEAIELWSRNYEQDSKFKPGIRTFFEKELYKTALYNLRAKEIAEVKNRKLNLTERLRARKAAKEVEAEIEARSKLSLADRVRVMRATRGESNSIFD